MPRGYYRKASRPGLENGNTKAFGVAVCRHDGMLSEDPRRSHLSLNHFMRLSTKKYDLVFDAERNSEIATRIEQVTCANEAQLCIRQASSCLAEREERQLRRLLFNEPANRQDNRRCLLRTGASEQAAVDAERRQVNEIGRSTQPFELCRHGP